jgi:hypothetical protein
MRAQLAWMSICLTMLCGAFLWSLEAVVEAYAADDLEMLASARMWCVEPLTNEEKEVAVVALGEVFHASSFVLDHEARGSHWRWGSRFEGELRTAHLAANLRPGCVEPSPEWRVLARPKKKELREDFWQWFRRTYAVDQFYSISRVGFSAGGKEAGISVGMHCGGLCGHGYDVRLVREPHRWRVVQVIHTWVS